MLSPRNRRLLALAAAAAFAVIATVALAAAPGEPAAAFTISDAAGKPVTLADFRGRFVVLEWTNPDCPFVQKHYGSGNMQSLQKAYGDRGVVWLSVNSTRPDHPDFRTAAQMTAWMHEQNAAPKAVLMDSAGTAGRAYAAKTTPHMFIVDPAGRLVYAGAIDDKRSANPADVKTARNHVRNALDEALAGKPVTVASTTPYGCSVKY